eukprot:737237-Pelagomonas_calceolata.AAC.1
MVNGKKSRRSECMPSSYLWRRGSSLYDTKGQCQAEKACHSAIQAMPIWVWRGDHPMILDHFGEQSAALVSVSCRACCITHGVGRRKKERKKWVWHGRGSPRCGRKEKKNYAGGENTPHIN